MRSLRSSVTASADSVAGSGRLREVHRDKTHFRATFMAMGSPCELLAAVDDEGEAATLADAVAAEAWRIEDKFSRYLSDNIVHRINSSKGRPVVVDDETASLLDFADMLHDMSEGRFDITSGVLREAWTFDGSDRIPEKQQIERILDRVGWHKIHWRRPELRLLPGMQIDLGGIAKEYAVDKAAGLLPQITSAACLVNFGGDLLATDAPAGTAGWQVGIDALEASGGRAQTLIRLKNGGLATSGDARRFLIKDGVRYGHILDPVTGWPVTDAPRSITVAADTCTQAGMLATLAMLRGRAAEAFLAEHGVQCWISN